MTERNVTRAAQQLCMTQPAVSNALKRLRSLLKDDLFIKVPGGVQPTAKATEVWLPIRESLARIRQTIQPSVFDPASSTATVTLAMTDYSAFLILPTLMAHLSKLAPSMTLRVIPNVNIDAAALLERGELDLAIGVFLNPGSRFRTQTLLNDEYQCAMRRENPLAHQPMTLKQFVQAKHLLISLTGEPTNFIDQLLEEKGLKREIALIINQFVLAPFIIAQSDLICTLPRRTIQQSGLDNHFYLTPLPLALDPKLVKMMWHERYHQNSMHSWVRSLVSQVCSSL